MPRRIPLRCLIVDDEPPARRLLAELLNREADVTIVADCSSGKEAVNAIKELKPDLVFLDIQMPQCDGFEVIRRVGAANMPAVVFVTAYDQYAIKAFQVHALDYLLKPFTQERFAESLAHARKLMVQGHDPRPRIQRLLREWQFRAVTIGDESPAKASEYINRLMIRDSDKMIAVPLDDVLWLEAADHYVLVHSTRGRHLMYESLSLLEHALPPSAFVRIHRGAIVNTRHIDRVTSANNGGYRITMSSGTELSVSRSRRDALRRIIPAR
jgi:two-component system LytT family response regulator